MLIYYKICTIKYNLNKFIPNFLIDFLYKYSSAISNISNLWFDFIYLVIFTNFPRYDHNLSNVSPSVRPTDSTVLG